MNYNTIELTVGAVLVLLPITAVSAAGMWCLNRAHQRMPWFFFLAPVGSIVISWLACMLAMAVFPRPYDAYFAGGRGLDLRGMIIIFGGMLGGFAGIVTSMVLCAGNLVRQYLQRGRVAHRNA